MMRIARTLLHASLLCSAAVLCSAGTAAAQSESARADGYRHADDSRWRDSGGYGANDQVRLLEQALERYRDIEHRGGWNKVPADLVMGPGHSYDCKRIALLERRLVAEGYLREEDTTPPPPPPPVPQPDPPGKKPRRGEPAAPVVQPPRRDAPMGLWGPCEYSPAVTAAVQAFQADRKVLGIGQVGGQTMTELNRPAREIVGILENDLDRWQGVSLDPSGTYLLVNIPFFELIVYEGGREAMRMPVVVGKRDWQTPTFHAEIQAILVNPDWGIPDKIAEQEYWPSARRDPGYLRRQGITATGGSLRQKAGPNNPLGRIKFVMPNPHDVYLHDTPAKGAFKAAVKALSHGCVRLGDAAGLANYLLRDEPQWSPRRLQAAVASGQTQQISLHSRMPVYIVYSTSRVNQEGRLELRPDVYAKNRKLPSPDEDRWTGEAYEARDTGP